MTTQPKTMTLTDAFKHGGSTFWRAQHILSLWRVFIGVSGTGWRGSYFRRSHTVRGYTPGHALLSMSGPSVSVKAPLLPFEVVLGRWTTKQANAFADSPGVQTLSVQAPGEVSDDATPIAEYHENVTATSPPKFVLAPPARWPNG